MGFSLLLLQTLVGNSGYNILPRRRIRSLLLFLLTLFMVLMFLRQLSIFYQSDIIPISIKFNQSGLDWNIQLDNIISTSDDSTLNLSYRVHGFYYAWYDAPQKLSNQNSLNNNDNNWSHWNHQRLKHWNPKVAIGYSTERHYPPYLLASSFYPKLGPYSSKDLNIIHIHMEMIRFAGIGVLVVSWYPKGMSDDNGKPVDDIIFPLLNIANKYGIKICLHLEPYKNRNVSTIVSDLKYIYEKGYTSHPAYYHVSANQYNNGKLLPVVYVYDSYIIKPSEWKKILQPNDEETTIRNKMYNVHMIGLLLETNDCRILYESGFNGGYTYFVGHGISKASSPDTWNDLSKECIIYNLTFYPSIGPGYHDLSVRPWNTATIQLREFGSRYIQVFYKAINIQLTGINIVSFNEWHEGTQIESSIPFEWRNYLKQSKIYMNYLPYSSEFYLRLTRLMINHFENFTNLPKKFNETDINELEWLYTLIKRIA
ncbi:unnamed protein product [Schistosoma margrebowiei]|uniref:Mannosidase endo-alpha n=1 Tax=Schistosoma margrebowiei TaxID=48269 RepID=A0AA85AMH9_9TREM|nr:unnamed protein product [Schistosoma margrebowiei]